MPWWSQSYHTAVRQPIRQLWNESASHSECLTGLPVIAYQLGLCCVCIIIHGLDVKLIALKDNPHIYHTKPGWKGQSMILKCSKFTFKQKAKITWNYFWSHTKRKLIYIWRIDSFLFDVITKSLLRLFTLGEQPSKCQYLLLMMAGWQTGSIQISIIILLYPYYIPGIPEYLLFVFIKVGLY